MKLIIVAVCALAAVSTAAPPASVTNPEVILIRSDIHQRPDGSYTFFVETSDGTVRQEIGELKEVVNEKNEKVSVIAVRGSYTTLDNEGHPQTISFNADENGYQATGDAIPKAPEPSRR